MSLRPAKKSYRLLALVLSGAVLGLSFPPLSLYPLAFVALVPLFLYWREADSGLEAYGLALMFYLGCFIVAFSWPLNHVLRHVAVASVTPLIVLIMIMAIPAGVGRALNRGSRGVAGIVLVCSMHLVVEFLLTKGSLAMPWPLLGYALAESPLRDIAAIGGVSGLSALVLLTNAVLTAVIVRHSRGRTALEIAALGLVVLGLPLVTARDPEESNRSLRIGIIQPSMPAEAWARVEDASRVDTLIAMTASLLETEVGLDLMVWPETALPPCTRSIRCAENDHRLAPVLGEDNPPLLAGAVVPSAGGRGRTSWYNAALLIGQGTEHEESQIYAKRRLVPFAEGVPLAERWPVLTRFALDAGGVASYRPGPSARPMRLANARAGVLICFESIFPADARRYARQGADILVVLSQDGWWGRTAGYAQHLAFTRLRAIETGLPVVFVAATGASAAFDSRGRIVEYIPYRERRASGVTVSLEDRSTIYRSIGDWVTPLGLILGVIAFLIGRFRRENLNSMK